MRFLANLNDAAKSNRTLVYRSEEFSFDVVPSPEDAFTSILFGDLNLEVNEAGKLVSVWGLCPHPKWKKAIATPPNYGVGDLIVRPHKPLQRGISIETPPRETHVYCDPASGWVKITPPNTLTISGDALVSVEIITGVVFEINREEELKTLWLRPRYLASGEPCSVRCASVPTDPFEIMPAAVPGRARKAVNVKAASTAMT